MKQPGKKSAVLKKDERVEPPESILRTYSTRVTVHAEDATVHPPKPALDTGRARGRPATGKRSNPEWKLYSHFLRKNTQRAAVAKLQAKDDRKDLSDLLQELLENWLKM
jgi:hypothetical protein